MTREGYAVLPSFFDPATVRRLRETVDAAGASAEQRSAGLVVVPEADDPRQVCRYERVLGTVPGLREEMLGRLAPVLRDLHGEPMTPFKDKVNNKHPGGGGYGPHQDIVAYRHFVPRYHLTAMITIDAASEQNGCLQVAEDWRSVVEAQPGCVDSHLDGHPVLNHVWGAGPGHGDILPEIASGFRWRSLITQPQDLVLIDSFVPHRSFRNMSAGSRRAMFLTFSPAKDGEWYDHYYARKMRDPLDPIFHVSTPTIASPGAGGR